MDTQASMPQRHVKRRREPQSFDPIEPLQIQNGVVNYLKRPETTQTLPKTPWHPLLQNLSQRPASCTFLVPILVIALNTTLCSLALHNI